MTITPLERTVSVRGILFGQADDAHRTPLLGHALTGRQLAQTALRRTRPLGAAALGAIDQQIGDVAEEMLDIDLGDVLVHGWSLHAKVRESARRTLSTPGSEVVALATHQLISTYHPAVDLLVDQRLVGSITFEVRLVFDVTGLAAVLREGCLVAVRGGDMLLTASLLLGEETIAQQQRRLDPELVVRLEPPVVVAAPAAEGPG